LYDLNTPSQLNTETIKEESVNLIFILYVNIIILKLLIKNFSKKNRPYFWVKNVRKNNVFHIQKKWKEQMVQNS